MTPPSTGSEPDCCSPSIDPSNCTPAACLQDERLLRVLDLVDNYITSTDLISQTFSKAFFNLAQTKYILGPGRLTQHQYDRRMRSHISLDVTGDEAGPFQIKMTTPESALVSKLSMDDTTPKTSSDGLEPPEHSMACESGLRRRAGNSSSSIAIKSQMVAQDLADDEHHRPKPSDATDGEDLARSAHHRSDTDPVDSATASTRRNPLHWFGVLVPSQLRQSQTNFKNGLEHTLYLVNLKLELMQLLKEYEATSISETYQK
ncbi:hypothetical protein BASA61_002499 [Batrachochytrium salamandrivorans]|nr:hypothetical protein BASA61_002499 [Batrachochytrium salamandrivorans]KAH9271503.1 hypothetical protein BASA83_006358 [Batrachochytrium salamandrivorans]KAJ1339910.1 hypothetical protein BSLG_005445 [Batrachochytrium salamandrivorans]